MNTLTVLTPYWQRPKMLPIWLAAMRGAMMRAAPEVRALVMFVGESVPEWVLNEYGRDPMFHFIVMEDQPGVLSIGHYHNEGAKMAQSEWMMKLDIDTLPNVRYFQELLAVLGTAKSREWFNGGMIYATLAMSHSLLSKDRMPLSEMDYSTVMANTRAYALPGKQTPQSTNFICRRQDYLKLGGCDPGFRGWGWEDYQQIYMLERWQLGIDPLPARVSLSSVTQACRDVISRPKAKQLLERSPWLCLIHHWHAKTGGAYRSQQTSAANRKVLYDYIMAKRQIQMVA